MIMRQHFALRAMRALRFAGNGPSVEYCGGCVCSEQVRDDAAVVRRRALSAGDATGLSARRDGAQASPARTCCPPDSQRRRRRRRSAASAAETTETPAAAAAAAETGVTNQCIGVSAAIGAHNFKTRKSLASLALRAMCALRLAGNNA